MFKRVLIILAVLTIYAVVAVNAQDSATDAPTPAPESTQVVNLPPATAEPPVIVVNNPPSNELPASAVNLFYAAIMAILGGGGALVILFRLLDNKNARDNAEKLYLSQSPEAQEHQRQLFELLSGVTLRLIDFLDKTTDGKPNEDVQTSKLPLNSLNSSEKYPVGLG